MAYFQTKQGGDAAINLPLGTTGGTVISVPNYGVSQIVATTADVYMLAPPIAGVEKTLVFHQYSTTVFPKVKLSSAASANPVSLLGSSTNLTVIISAAGKSTIVPTVVQMKGISSTLWCITNVFPSHVTTGTTAVAVGITLTST